LALVAPAFIYYFPVFGFYGGVTVVLKLVLIIMAFLLSRKIITYLFAVKILEINKEKKELKYFLEEFSTKTSDIKEISILEEDYGNGGANVIQYRLRFVMPEGEKTSAFAMTSYNKAQEIIELIKNSS
jgi:hypothetical protein